MKKIALFGLLLSIITFSSYAYFSNQKYNNDQYLVGYNTIEILNEPSFKQIHEFNKYAFYNNSPIDCYVRVYFDFNDSKYVKQFSYNNKDYTKQGDYYYYNKVLKAYETSPCFLLSIDLLNINSLDLINCYCYVESVQCYSYPNAVNAFQSLS